MRRLLRTRPAPLAEAGRRPGRLPGRWLAALLVTGVLALLVPGVSLAAASQSRPATAAAATAATASMASTADAAVGCRGVTPAVVPAAGFITNPSRSQAGHLWWRPATGGICIGTVIEWVQYNTTATKTWRVIVYSAQHPNGQVVAQRTFTDRRGHRVPVHDGPGQDEQPDADRHEHEIQTLIPAGRLRSRLVRVLVIACHVPSLDRQDARAGGRRDRWRCRSGPAGEVFLPARGRADGGRLGPERAHVDRVDPLPWLA